MFSNSKIRLLYANLYNLNNFKHITMYLNGYNIRDNYNSIKEILNFKRLDMFSYKLKKSGIRTQFLLDITKIILKISKSKPCKDNTDIVMFKEMNFNGIIDETNCLQMDGAYKFRINKILETHKNLKSINFTCPIRKEVNCNFVECELSYNKEFGEKKVR
ncbi:hypothetical protein ABK040_014522 [Willaertia magna]